MLMVLAFVCLFGHDGFAALQKRGRARARPGISNSLETAND
ncbi:MAG TPA: hypothetical protein PLK00_03930 [Candidatus Hydrogenedentes bacterium]|jgi:hypothetical protein|nr:hypothetical protein [Candidatus Hydrogenedentota bacterium]